MWARVAAATIAAVRPPADMETGGSSLSSVRACLCVVLAALLCTGCIGIQLSPSPGAERLAEPAPDERPSTPLRLAVDVRVRGIPAAEDLRSNLHNDVANVYGTYLQRTGRVTSPEADGAAYQVRIRVLDEGGGPGVRWAIALSVMTAFVIPHWIQHDYTTALSITDPSGAEFATKTYRHTLIQVGQLFLVFGMPFASTESAYREMWQEVLADAASWTVERIDARTEPTAQR